MSDEPESTRFPRQVWDDFAVNAARCGFVACMMWFPQAAKHVRAGNDIPALLTCAVSAFVASIALSVLVAVVSTHYRHLGLAVPGGTLLFAGIGLMAVSGEAWPFAFGLVVGGYFFGLLAALRRLLVLPPLKEGEPELLTRTRRFHDNNTSVFAYIGLAANVPPLIVGFIRSGGGTVPDEVTAVAFWYMLVLSAVLCVWCWLRFFRPFVELCLEPLFRIMYRVKAKGSLKQFPSFGPCLVIANHAFWLDPIVLAMILPRPVTPIMTQRFYDKWFLRPLLKYVFRVIVVPETTMKRETPELEQAVAALDRGEVVVIFPEGYLQRKEEVPLRRFGQGVWRILRARPDTPVVACWIEGGWGSFFSYRNGLPMKNKRMDLRRKIDIAVSVPGVVPAEVLVDQMATRVCLMNRVAGMRAELGLTPLPAFELPHATEHHEESA